MVIKTKSVYVPINKEEGENGDGIRVFIAESNYKVNSRDGPYGYDCCFPELSASKPLRYMLRREEIKFKEFKKRLIQEYGANPNAVKRIKELTELSKRQNITLLCFEHSENLHCHRNIVKELIEKSLKNQSKLEERIAADEAKELLHNS